MKVGQPVVVLVQRKEQSSVPFAQDRIRKGTVQSERTKDGVTYYMVALGLPHEFNYEVKEFPQGDVTRFEPLNEETAADQHASELTQALDGIQAALAALLPGETVEVKEGSIFGYHGGVTLDPVIYETKRIGCIAEKAAWQVTTWQTYPANRIQPEETVDATVGTFPCGQAVQKFIETIFALKAADYWQHKADEAMAAAWEHEES